MSNNTKIMIINILTILVASINIFLNNLLNGYFVLLSLFIISILLTIFLSNPKVTTKRLKYNILDISLILIITFTFLYLFSILTDFTSAKFDFTSLLLKIPFILNIILIERIRYYTIIKTNNLYLKILITISLIIVYVSISSNISIYLLPIIINNILCTYLTKEFGYYPLIYYLIIINTYYYLPFLPNLSDNYKSLINTILSIIIIFRYNYNINENNIKKSRKKGWLIIYLIIIILLFTLVYYTSGIFKYQAIVVRNDTMFPTIDNGDIIFINKDMDLVGKDDIIAYYYNDNLIVSRVYEIKVFDNELYYYTKGDNDIYTNNYLIKKEDILGVLTYHIHKLGLLK